MKNSLQFITSLLLAFILFGCEKTPDYLLKSKPVLEIFDGDFRLQSNDVHFYTDTVYIIKCHVNINPHQNLIIDKGVLIKMENNFQINLSAGSGITANGTAAEPIIFTSNMPKGSQGKDGTGWNGITVNGSANAANIKMSFIRIEFAGVFKTALTLNAIGKEASIHHIQVSYAVNSNAFEINGGSFDCSHLVAYANAGSDYILKSGYNGRMQYILAYRHPLFSISTGSPKTITGMLIDGANTFPLISNLSVIGPDIQAATSLNYFDTLSTFSGARVAGVIGSNRARFQIKNSLIAGFPKGALFLDNRETGIALQFGPSSFTYNVVQSNDTGRLFYIAKGIYPDYTSNEFKQFMLEPRFNNLHIIPFNGLKLTDPFQYNNGPIPTPSLNSILMSGANFQDTTFSKSFFQKVNYKGALGTDKWTEGWVNYLPLQTDY